MHTCAASWKILSLNMLMMFKLTTWHRINYDSKENPVLAKKWNPALLLYYYNISGWKLHHSVNLATWLISLMQCQSVVCCVSVCRLWDVWISVYDQYSCWGCALCVCVFVWRLPSHFSLREVWQATWDLSCESAHTLVSLHLPPPLCHPLSPSYMQPWTVNQSAKDKWWYIFFHRSCDRQTITVRLRQ